MPVDDRSPRVASSGAESTRNGVVVGVDGSPASSAAVRWAADWAHQRRTPLRLVTAHPVAARSAVAHVRVTRDLHTLLIKAAATAVSRHPELSIAMDVLHQSPSAALVELGAHADLVVVGKRGAGGWSNLLLGSVAADVASHAACVVVVVPPTFDNARSGPVVLGLDGGPESREAAEFAFRTAQGSSGRLTAVHVVPEPQTLFTGPTVVAAPPGPDGAPQLPQAIEATLERCTRRHPGVTVERRTAVGSPAIELSHAAAHASLVVVGSRGRGGFTGLLLGSTSQDLLQAADCPVAVVRPGDLGVVDDRDHAVHDRRTDGGRRPLVWVRDPLPTPGGHRED